VFRVKGLGFRVWGIRVLGSRFRVHGVGVDVGVDMGIGVAELYDRARARLCGSFSVASKFERTCDVPILCKFPSDLIGYRD
jgi:hypothetical protein